MLEYLKNKQAETKVSDSDMLTAIWHAIMENMDWNAKPEHLDAMAVKCANVSFTFSSESIPFIFPSDTLGMACSNHSQTYAGLLEPFCNGAKAEVGLLNTVQVYCYSETRVMKAFPQLVKVRGPCLLPPVPELKDIKSSFVTGPVQHRLRERSSHYLLG